MASLTRHSLLLSGASEVVPTLPCSLSSPTSLRSSLLTRVSAARRHTDRTEGRGGRPVGRGESAEGTVCGGADGGPGSWDLAFAALLTPARLRPGRSRQASVERGGDLGGLPVRVHVVFTPTAVG